MPSLRVVNGKARKIVRGYIPVVETGMYEIGGGKHMQSSDHMLPMMVGDGPFGGLGAFILTTGQACNIERVSSSSVTGWEQDATM